MMAAACARVLMQQAIHAKLQTAPADDKNDAKFVEINRGVVVFVCFFKGCKVEDVTKTVNSVLNVKLSYCEKRQKNVSILDLPGDVLIIPQATLGGKMKGKVTQYHSNIPKEEGVTLYEDFVKLVESTVENCENFSGQVVHHGTYGNRQVLSMETNGPYTHLFEF